MAASMKNHLPINSANIIIQIHNGKSDYKTLRKKR